MTALLPDDCAATLRAIGDAMLEHELPEYKSVEWCGDAVWISVPPEHFTRWRVAFGTATPMKLTTQVAVNHVARGFVDGVPLRLVAHVTPPSVRDIEAARAGRS